MAAVISVIATSNGKETDGSPSVFSFSRTGDTNTALSVSYQLFGTAQAGSDYTGNTTGTVSFAVGSSSATLSLPVLADGALIDPYETIIARINPAADYEIATGKQFATATITAEGMFVSPKGISSPDRSSGEYGNGYAFAALKNDGSVVSWGERNSGGVAPAGLTGVSQIYSNVTAFTALKSDGSVISWGDYWDGSKFSSTKSPAGLTGVSQIFSTNTAFAALKSDGTVTTWGDSTRGGTAPAGLTGVSQIFSTSAAFAALKNDGSVISWGRDRYSGNEITTPPGLTGVSQIFSNNSAFAALKSDGSIISWGDSNSGGNAPSGLTGVSKVFSVAFAFAALKSDGSVISWGNSSNGGDAPTGLIDVSHIFSTNHAFAALKNDGSVISWGNRDYGGSAPAGLTGVSHIFSTNHAFAALKNDGSVISWGNRDYGGSAPAGLTGVSQIFSTGSAFTALKYDGSAISWGNRDYGGSAPAGLTGVSQIFSTGGAFGGAFAALKSDGSVISWGDSSSGGSAPAGLTGVVGFANPYTDDRLEIGAAPTYTLTPSTTSINEGAVLTNTVATTNVATGTKLYYALSGTGITTADFAAGALTGEGTTDATGKFTFTHTLANDLTTEGVESLSIKLYSDTARTLQVGSTATVSIADTSISYPLTLTAWTGNSQLPTTTVSENLGIINFRTSDLPAFSSKNYYWLLSGEGVTKDDFLNSGTFTSSIAFSGIVKRAGLITQPGPLALSFQFRQDEQYENESITLSLFSDAQMIDPVAAPLTIRILDSHTYTLTPSATTINEGAVLTSTVSTTNVASGTKFYYALSGTGITTADFSAGALTGEGTTDSTGKFTFTHTLANDLTTEGAETLELKLFSDAARKVQVGATASVSIADTSITPPPQIAVAATTNGKETDGSPAVFSFSRTGDTNTALSVSYQLFGTAKAGSDYTGNTTGTINFAAGSSSATLSLPALADGALIDPYETIIARINPASSYGITTGKQFATATITAEGMVVVPKGQTHPGASSGERNNYNAFAALKNDGSVVSWGDSKYGVIAPAGLTGVSQIFSNGYAFAALKSDGSVVSWGDSSSGGKAPSGLTGVDQIFSTYSAFAALKSDGSVIAWGTKEAGGSAPAGLTGVSQIFSTGSAFAALKTDGSVIAWGGSGGSAPAGLTGVSQIFSANSAFAALKSDGSVVSWGYSSDDGNAPAGLTGVVQIFSTLGAFAALKSDGSVICWGGSRSFGGRTPEGLTGVAQIFSTIGAFTALNSDGTVVSWGASNYGGNSPEGLTGISQIFSTISAFAALKSDGSVISWGTTNSADTEITAPAGLTGVTQIFSTSFAFAALKSDGSVICWGDSEYGGKAPSGLTGVSHIFSTSQAFAALKNDGSVVSWGDSGYGGRAPAGLTGVVGFANPYTDDRLVIEATPTYTLTPSATTINEGATLITSIATTDVASGTTLYYSLSGIGITTSDFSAGALTGEGITDATGKFTFTHTLANDLTTEDAETLSIKLYSDVARTLQVGTTATVSILDTSVTKDTTPPAIALTTSKASLTAGEQATITFTLSEDSIDFTASDISTSNSGTLSDFKGSGKIYTATFTPKANTTAASVVAVANKTFSDTAGNFNNDEVEANNKVTFFIDTVVAPGVKITLPGDLSTDENGKSVVIPLVLKTEPKAAVRLDFLLSKGAEASLSAKSFEFSTANWSTAQSLTLKGTEDYVDDIDQKYSLTITGSSTDKSYQTSTDPKGLNIPLINLINLDDGEDEGKSIYGDAGAQPIKDTLNGTEGPDRIYGKDEDDILYGGAGRDELFGGYGKDVLYGEIGDDELYGENENDTLYGGEGNDRLTGGEGFDKLIGGAGNDTYVIDDERDTIDDQGLDTDIDTVLFRANLTTYTMPASIKNAVLDSGSAFKLIGNGLDNNLKGNDNNNEIDGGDGNDVLNGGGGDDLLKGGSGSDTAHYHKQLPGFTFGAEGGAGITANLLTGKATGTEIGNDTLVAIENIETSDGSDTLIGNENANILIANGGNDLLQANGGDDILIGGQGDDLLDGGEGNDQAVYSGVRDDYEVSQDSTGTKVIIKDKRQFQDGIDTITGIETVKFANQSLVLADLTSKTLDFNGDGNVDTFDSILMMRHMMGTYPGESIKKDIPGNFDFTFMKRRLDNAFADTFSLNGGLRLDIDGDKRISAFGDGIMITQHIHKQGKSDTPWMPPGFNPPAGFPDQMQQHLKDLIGF